MFPNIPQTQIKLGTNRTNKSMDKIGNISTSSVGKFCKICG
jgi:hypothetical protein